MSANEIVFAISVSLREIDGTSMPRGEFGRIDKLGPGGTGEDRRDDVGERDPEVRPIDTSTVRVLSLGIARPPISLTTAPAAWSFRFSTFPGGKKEPSGSVPGSAAHSSPPAGQR